MTRGQQKESKRICSLRLVLQVSVLPRRLARLRRSCPPGWWTSTGSSGPHSPARFPDPHGIPRTRAARRDASRKIRFHVSRFFQRRPATRSATLARWGPGRRMTVALNWERCRAARGFPDAVAGVEPHRMNGARSKLIFRGVGVQAKQVRIRPVVQSRGMTVRHRACAPPAQAGLVGVWSAPTRAATRQRRGPQHQLKRLFRVGRQGTSQSPAGLGDIAGIFSSRRGMWTSLPAPSKSSQTAAEREQHRRN